MKTAPLLIMLLAVVARVTLAQAAEPTGGLRPLAPFATRHLVVVPAVYLQPGDALGWAAQVPEASEYLANFDAELSFALKERGLDQVWVMSSRLDAEYRRNADYMANPHQLAAFWLRYPGPKKLPSYLPDPLAAQLRSILAMNDKTEFVLIPIEIRFEKDPAGGGRAMLRCAIIDPRRLKIVWMDDIPSETVPSLSPALSTSLAENLVSLFIGPH